jgi:hypothetical protein
MDVREWKHFAFEDLVELAKIRDPGDCAVLFRNDERWICTFCCSDLDGVEDSNLLEAFAFLLENVAEKSGDATGCVSEFLVFRWIKVVLLFNLRQWGQLHSLLFLFYHQSLCRIYQRLGLVVLMDGASNDTVEHVVAFLWKGNSNE